MSAGELLGLPGVGKSHLLLSLPGAEAARVRRGWGRDKLANLLAGLWYAGPAVIRPLLSLRLYRCAAGQNKLLLVLCERLGRVRRLGSDRVIDEGVLQALWGILWRSRPEAASSVAAARLVAVLGLQLGVIHYVRCRREVHCARVAARACAQPELRVIAFSGEEQYHAARRAMAALLRLLRCSGIRPQYIDNSALRSS